MTGASSRVGLSEADRIELPCDPPLSLGYRLGLRTRPRHPYVREDANAKLAHPNPARSPVFGGLEDPEHLALLPGDSPPDM